MDFLAKLLFTHQSKLGDKKMPELHSTVMKTVTDELMKKWEKKNPYPKLRYSDEVISEVLNALKQSDEFKITETLFKSDVRELIPSDILDCSVSIIDDDGVLVASDFKLKNDSFPTLAYSLPSKERCYGIITSHGARLGIKNGERVKHERDSFARSQRGWLDRHRQARAEIFRNLEIINSIQDLYAAWPEAAEFLPESAKVTGVVLPVDNLNKMLGLGDKQ